MTESLPGATAPLREDYESGVASSDRIELRIWLRLLTCCTMIEGEVRQRLHQEFDTTLPRFDVLAQLHRAGGPLSMGELSRRMMVTNGNITGLVDRLEGDGLLRRRPDDNDRRVQMVSLTRDGRKFFDAMAADNNIWVSDMMAGLGRSDMQSLLRLLAKLKASVLDAWEEGEENQ